MIPSRNQHAIKERCIQGQFRGLGGGEAESRISSYQHSQLKSFLELRGASVVVSWFDRAPACGADLAVCTRILAQMRRGRGLPQAPAQARALPGLQLRDVLGRRQAPLPVRRVQRVREARRSRTLRRVQPRRRTHQNWCRGQPIRAAAQQIYRTQSSRAGGALEDASGTRLCCVQLLCQPPVVNAPVRWVCFLFCSASEAAR